jgi:hypothetical protein
MSVRNATVGPLLLLVCSCGGGTTASNAPDGAVATNDGGGTVNDAPSTGNDAGAPDVDVTCPISGTGGLSLAGQLAGMAVSQTYAVGGVGSGFDLEANPPLMASAEFGTQGLLLAVGTGSTPLSTIAVTDGIVLMPAEGPDPGSHYCVHGGTVTVTSGSGATWSFTSLARAGACPSSGPSQGDWTGCITDGYWTPEDGGGPYEGASCVAGSTATTHLVGQLNGSAFDWMIPEGDVGIGGNSSGGGTDVFNAMEGIGNLGLLEIRGAGDDAGASNVLGSLQLPASVSPERAIICIPPASTATMTDHALRFTLRGVTLAGSCGAATSDGSHLAACSD